MQVLNLNIAHVSHWPPAELLAAISAAQSLRAVRVWSTQAFVDEPVALPDLNGLPALASLHTANLGFNPSQDPPPELPPSLRSLQLLGTPYNPTGETDLLVTLWPAFGQVLTNLTSLDLAVDDWGAALPSSLLRLRLRGCCSAVMFTENAGRLAHPAAVAAGGAQMLNGLGRLSRLEALALEHCEWISEVRS